MKLLSRPELIRAQKWVVVTVETLEYGPLRIAAPTAHHATQPRDDATPRGQLAQVLHDHCVDENGEPIFGSLAVALDALASLSIESANKIALAFAGMTERATSSGNSRASQGDGSPSVSASPSAGHTQTTS